jgi:hypothetical protein
MSNRFKVTRPDAAAISAKVVKFEPVLNRSIFDFVKNSMSHCQNISKPNAGVSISLFYWVIPAACLLVYGWFNSGVPFGYPALFPNSAHVLFVGNQFKMRPINTGTIFAKVVQFESIGDTTEPLPPKKDMSQVQSAISANSGIAVPMPCGKFPAACFAILFIVNPHAVAWVEVQPRVSFHVAASCKSGDGRVAPATAEAFSSGVRVGQVSRHCSFVMVFQKPRVAAGYQLAREVGSVCDQCVSVATALTTTARVRPVLVVWANRVSALLPTLPVAAKVPKKFSGDLVGSVRNTRAGYSLPTSAHAKSAGVRRFDGSLRLGSHAGVVAADKALLRGKGGSASALTGGAHLLRLCGFNACFHSPLGTRRVTFTEVA